MKAVLLSRYVKKHVSDVSQVHTPEKNVESKHGKHDGEISNHTHSVAQLVNEEEPLIHHPAEVK